MKELGQALDEMKRDKNIGAVVLTGSEKAFAGNIYLTLTVFYKR